MRVNGLFPNAMVKHHRAILFFFFAFVAFFSLLNKAELLSSGDPGALALGQAYTALVKGALAPLWNPAGNYEASGIQGALAFCLLPDERILFYTGGAVATTDGPAVSWTSVRHSGAEGEIVGAFSCPLQTELRMGGSLAYLFGGEGDATSISFNAGVSFRGERLWLGASGFGLESIVAEGKWPSRVLLGVALRAFPWIRVAVDLHFCSQDAEVALGGEARVLDLTLRWGSALALDGRLTHLGLGLSFSLLGFSTEVGIGLMGSGLQLVYSFGIAGVFPLWW